MFVNWNESASQDLEEIFDHILSSSPQGALIVDRRITEQVQMLAEFSEIGRLGRVPGTHELVIDGTAYVAVYRIEDGTVFLLRILHGAQQWPSVI